MTMCALRQAPSRSLAEVGQPLRLWFSVATC